MEDCVLKSLLSTVLSLLLAATPMFAAPNNDQTAGEVKALIPSASRNAQPVKAKDSLAWNDLLQTGSDGRLRAGLTNGSILSLGSNSELRVVQHDAVAQQTALEMNYGKLRSQVVKVTKPGGKYEVTTPNAVVGVIGTDFYIGYANNQTTVICYVGKVAVTPASGAKVVKSDNASNGSANTVTLTAGQMVVIGMDVPPGGYQATSTPATVAEASMQDTNVPNEPLSAANLHPHTLRYVLIGLGAAAGLGVGLGIAETRGGGHAISPGTGCQSNPDGC
jgi:ferric-dicitrate binding protein FerR (iron transport regulator)